MIRSTKAVSGGVAVARTAALVVGLVLGSAAGAPVAGAEPVEGHGVIEAVDTVRAAIVIDGVSYQVDDSTRLEGAGGGRLALDEVPSLSGEASPDEAAAWFVASERGAGTWELEHLRLTGAVPR